MGAGAIRRALLFRMFSGRMKTHEDPGVAGARGFVGAGLRAYSGGFHRVMARDHGSTPELRVSFGRSLYTD